MRNWTDYCAYLEVFLPCSLFFSDKSQRQTTFQISYIDASNLVEEKFVGIMVENLLLRLPRGRNETINYGRQMAHHKGANFNNSDIGAAITVIRDTNTGKYKVFPHPYFEQTGYREI